MQLRLLRNPHGTQVRDDGRLLQRQLSFASRRAYQGVLTWLTRLTAHVGDSAEQVPVACSGFVNFTLK